MLTVLPQEQQQITSIKTMLEQQFTSKNRNKISLTYLLIVSTILAIAYLETRGVTGNQRELLLQFRGQRIESFLLFFASSLAFFYLYFTYNMTRIYNYFFLNYGIYVGLISMNSLYHSFDDSSVYACIVRLSYYFKYIALITLIASTIQLDKDRKNFLAKKKILEQKLKSLEDVE